MSRLILLLLTGLLAAADSKKPLPPAQSGNELVDVTASAYVDKADVAARLGLDPGVAMIVVDVKVVPKGETKLKLFHDDFTLLSSKDGQRSQPLSPSQIAGNSVLVVSGDRGGAGFGIGSMDRGPIWGGIGDRPRRLGGDDQVVGASTGEAKATIHAKEGGNQSPVLKTLKDKILPEKETGEDVSGLLYFIFDGKHKLKDLELLYKTAAGRLVLDFQR